MQIEIPDNIIVPLGRNAAYGTMEYVTTRFAPHVALHVFEYGLRQLTNDAMADKTDDDGKPLPADQIVAKAEKRRDTLYSGALRLRRGEVEPIDPVEREQLRLAKAHAIELLKKTDEYKSAKGKDRIEQTVAARHAADNSRPDTFDGVIAVVMPHWRKQAERNVRDMERAAADINV